MLMIVILVTIALWVQGQFLSGSRASERRFWGPSGHSGIVSRGFDCLRLASCLESSGGRARCLTPNLPTKIIPTKIA